jgi:hypothetical protein
LAQEFISKYCIPQGKVSRAYLKVPSFALGLVQHAEMIGGIDPGQMVEDIMIWGLGNAFHGPRLPRIIRICRCSFLTLQRRSSLCIPEMKLPGLVTNFHSHVSISKKSGPILGI